MSIKQKLMGTESVKDMSEKKMLVNLFKLICMANCLIAYKDFLAPLMYQPLKNAFLYWNISL